MRNKKVAALVYETKKSFHILVWGVDPLTLGGYRSLMMQHFNADFKNKEIYPFPFYLSIDNKEMTFRPIGTLTHSVTGKNLISIRRKLKEDTEYLLSGNSEDEPTIEVYKYRGK